MLDEPGALRAHPQVTADRLLVSAIGAREHDPRAAGDRRSGPPPPGRVAGRGSFRSSTPWMPAEWNVSQ